MFQLNIRTHDYHVQVSKNPYDILCVPYVHPTLFRNNPQPLHVKRPPLGRANLLMASAAPHGIGTGWDASPSLVGMLLRKYEKFYSKYIYISIYIYIYINICMWVIPVENLFCHVFFVKCVFWSWLGRDFEGVKTKALKLQLESGKDDATFVSFGFAMAQMGVSITGGTPRPSIFMEFSPINHPSGVPPFMETPTWKRHL